MANLIKYLAKDVIQIVEIIDNGKEVIGVIRAEVGEDMLLMHPRIYSPTKTKFLEFRKSFEVFLRYMKSEYYYEKWHGLLSMPSLSDNKKWADMISNNRAYPVKYIMGRPLYECEIQ